jgi:hypothetical protein
MGLTNPHLKNKLVTNIHKKPRTWTDAFDTRPKRNFLKNKKNLFYKLIESHTTARPHFHANSAVNHLNHTVLAPLNWAIIYMYTVYEPGSLSWYSYMLDGRDSILDRGKRVFSSPASHTSSCRSA